MSCFISKYQISTRELRFKRVFDEYGVHKLVYSLFSYTDEPQRVLYRKTQSAYGLEIVVSSQRPPVEHPQIGQIESKQMPESFLSHDKYLFQLRLNPAFKEDRQLKIYSDEPQLREKLLSCSTRWGFSLSDDECMISIGSPVVFRKKKDEESFRVTLASSELMGVLTVTDKEKFEHSVMHGIGRGRAFGFGMLQLRPC